MALLAGRSFAAAASLYVWILPLFQPRGDLLWGHYRLKDIYIGIPIALATLCALLILAVPHSYRRKVSARVVTVAVAVFLSFAVSDVVYAFGVMGAFELLVGPDSHSPPLFRC